jgi:hypothetical protein
LAAVSLQARHGGVPPAPVRDDFRLVQSRMDFRVMALPESGFPKPATLSRDDQGDFRI